VVGPNEVFLAGRRVEAVSYTMALASLADSEPMLEGGDQGTLTRETLDALLGTCEELDLRPRDCAPRIIARRAPFNVLSPAIAGEARLLLRECLEGQTLEDCRRDIEDKRYLRDQKLGPATPLPLEMTQFQKTVWSIKVSRATVKIVPGEEIPVVVESGGSEGGGENSTSDGRDLIVYNEKTCFLLKFDERDFELHSENPTCPVYQKRGNTPYKAEWQVTPQRSGKLRLRVQSIPERDGRKLTPESVQPDPFIVTVTPVETWLTMLFERWQGLLAALLGVLGAIWALLRFLRKPDGDATGAPQPAKPRANASPAPPAS